MRTVEHNTFMICHILLLPFSSKAYIISLTASHPSTSSNISICFTAGQLLNLLNGSDSHEKEKTDFTFYASGICPRVYSVRQKEEADSSSQQETASQETESTEEQITEETGDIGASEEEVETEENENSVEENAQKTVWKMSRLL